MSVKNLSILRRAFLIWTLIIAAEFLHGILRVLLLEPLVGDFRARQIAVFTGMLIILTISRLFVGWLRAANDFQLFLAGLIWVVLTIAFEISLGRLLGFSWERILSDYDISNGGLMLLGLLFLMFAPLIAAKLREKSATNFTNKN